MDSNEAFYEQLRLQQLYGNPDTDHGQDPYTFKDPSDGTEYEWDLEKKAWFPKITEDFLALYHANYGFDQDNKDGSATSEASQTAPIPKKPLPKAAEKPKEGSKSQPDQGEPKAKGEKRKADPGWFKVEDQRNTNVYVTGLPPDVTNDEFAQLMSRCGIIMRDPQSEEFKIKLYKDNAGNLKGDGLCCYLKRESVELALKLLDEYEIRGYKLHVESAKFQLKGEYDATKKKKKSKDYRKKLSLQQKQLDWRPEKKDSEVRKRFERVVMIKNMFHPSDFEEDPLVLNEIREDLRSECEKFGQVKKVLIFDRHPDGVASVSFKEADESDACILALNGRWFGGRQLAVEAWDGVTDYQIEETSREREERLKGWETFLQTDEQKKAADVSSDGSKPPVNNGQSESKPDNNTEPAQSTDNHGQPAGSNEAELAAAQGTDNHGQPAGSNEAELAAAQSTDNHRQPAGSNEAELAAAQSTDNHSQPAGSNEAEFATAQSTDNHSQPAGSNEAEFATAQSTDNHSQPAGSNEAELATAQSTDNHSQPAGSNEAKLAAAQGTDNHGQPAGSNEAELAADDAASTDSSIGCSDDEEGKGQL
ncbi:17S U2 SnRNP complex component HTATSF1 [Pseudophryne corroboree]|uniref:17S U2 SnRNP complex component HTATSF1 n=1 Tax=Pseudophryne corroboree TaxID=495146 RepID=UPI0030819FFA